LSFYFQQKREALSEMFAWGLHFWLPWCLLPAISWARPLLWSFHYLTPLAVRACWQSFSFLCRRCKLQWLLRLEGSTFSQPWSSFSLGVRLSAFFLSSSEPSIFLCGKCIILFSKICYCNS
jgi:hypothetical protein